jgi:hypothetical protein
MPTGATAAGNARLSVTGASELPPCSERSGRGGSSSPASGVRLTWA